MTDSPLQSEPQANTRGTGEPSAPASTAKPNSPWQKHKAEIGLAALVLYVFLLALGTVGELLDIEWILDLPLFRPPGKF